MSARSYQLKLREALDKLTVAAKTAREWKTVADNRLILLHDIDKSIGEQIDSLLQIGTIFGVDPKPPGLPVAKDSNLAGEETTGLVLEKLTAIASFTANLTREASALQETLEDTLQLAVDATLVDPPKEDLGVHRSKRDTLFPSSPLREIYREIEDLTEENDEEANLVSNFPEIIGISSSKELTLASRGLFSM